MRKSFRLFNNLKVKIRKRNNRVSQTKKISLKLHTKMKEMKKSKYNPIKFKIWIIPNNYKLFQIK